MAALIAAIGARRRHPIPLGRGIAAIALASFVYWWLHGLGDWLWSFPALTAPIFAWLGISASLGRRRGAGEGPAPERGGIAAGRFRVPRVAAIAGAAAVGLLAALAFALPWASARDVSIASEGWRADPVAAYERLDRARQLNFLSASPDLTAGTIASQLGDQARVRESFARALQRDPDNWYALLELGTVEVLGPDPAAGLEDLQRAQTLNPRDQLIARALRLARAGKPLALAQINDALLQRVCSVVGSTTSTRFCR